MINAKQIYDYIDSIAPFETQMSFDNAGLLVGSEQTKSEKVLIALDADRSVIEEAIRLDANIIVTHHPVIFRPLKTLLSDSVPYLAAQNRITIISAHTNLDIARGGVNDTLAAAIGVTADQFFDEDCALLGHFENVMHSSELAQKIKQNLRIHGLRYTDSGNPVRTAVVACGAGGGSVDLAASLGADAIITGEIKHHEIIFANEHHIAVFDLGHYHSENLIIGRLADLFRQQFPDTEWICSASFTDGMIYLS